MTNPLKIRKREDLSKLQALQKRASALLEIKSVKGDPPREINIQIRIPTAKNRYYPSEKQDFSEVSIQLPEKYPFNMPYVIFNTPIWNPNVYSSNKWCFGDWQVTENLELFVIRLMKVIALDPTIINPKSPANIDASNWYVSKLKSDPKIFPTVAVAGFANVIEKQKIKWKNI